MEMTRFPRRSFVSMFRFPVLTVGLALAVCWPDLRSAEATMPSAPIEVSLETSPVTAVDTEFTVTLTARPLMAAPQLSLTITLPPGVELVSGETAWRGAAASGELKTVTITARARKAAPGVIRGGAVIELPDGAKLGDSRSITLPLGDRTKPQWTLPPPKKTKTGEPVIEYRDDP
ncbi:MAG: hypothetical protein ABIO65_07160 [Nitrospiria bacterium]